LIAWPQNESGLQLKCPVLLRLTGRASSFGQIGAMRGLSLPIAL
jgi:hypothetical protein